MSGPPAELVFQELASFVYGEAAHCCDCSRVEPAARAAGDAVSPRFDLSKTLDGAIIASDAFREVCDDVPGLSFTPIGGAGHWSLEFEQIVTIDPFESHVRSGPTCATCGLPRYVTRSGPLRLDRAASLPPGFSCTHIEFGDSADFGAAHPIRLRPHVLVDRPTARLLKSTSLLGIHLITQP